MDDFLNLTLESNDVAKRNLSKRDESGESSLSLASLTLQKRD